MFPVLYHSENIIIDSYSIFFLLAWIIGGIVFYREFRRLDWELEQMLFVMAGCVFGAVIGSYLFNAIFSGWEEIPQKIRLLDFSGKTVLGGIAGGFIAVELTKKKIGYPHSTGDAFALAIPLGHAIGRVGCFLGGCCFGTECSLPWAVVYPEGSVAHITQMANGLLPATATMSLAVHPTPIYEIIFNLGLFAYFWQNRDSFKVRGSMFRLYLVLYGSFRLLEEFIRGDSPMPDAGFMKPVQWLLLLAVLYFARVFYNNELKPEKTI
jgi:prolipoprotein diacylglyceryltransferase